MGARVATDSARRSIPARFDQEATMPRFSTPLPLAIGALLTCAVVAAPASAVTAYNQSTGVNLGLGESISGATSAGSHAQLTVGTDVYSCDSTLGGTVQANANTSAHVVFAVNSMTWSNCTDNTGGICTPTTENLPWTTTSYNGNGGGILAASTTSIDLGTGSGDFTWFSGCGSALAGCVWQGGTAGPSDGLDNYFSGIWDNTAATLTLNAVAAKSPNCPTLSGTWTAAYKLTLPGTSGAPVGFH